MFSVLLTDILTAVYETLGFSLCLSFFIMYFYLYSYIPSNDCIGWKKSIGIWFSSYKKNKKFRKLFYLVLFTTMILCKTLLSRNMWENPLFNVMGHWNPIITDPMTGEVYWNNEPIENMVMFIPFTFLVFYNEDAVYGVLERLKKGILISFFFSFLIELIQLLFRLGTFQLSDLFYNTVGGCVGTVVYFLFVVISKKK